MEQLTISNFLHWAHERAERAEQFGEKEDREIALREIEAGFTMLLTLRPESATQLAPIREILRARLSAPTGSRWVLWAPFVDAAR